MESDPAGEPKPQLSEWRERLAGWPAAIAIVVIGALVLVTGAVLLWLVITTLGALLRTIF